MSRMQRMAVVGLYFVLSVSASFAQNQAAPRTVVTPPPTAARRESAVRTRPAIRRQPHRSPATAAARDQEAAGIDIVTDGEQTRRHFVWGFVEQLEGVDFSKMVTIGIRADRYKAEVPTVAGPLRRRGPIHRDEAQFLRAATGSRIKFVERVGNSCASFDEGWSDPQGSPISKRDD